MTHFGTSRSFPVLGNDWQVANRFQPGNDRPVQCEVLSLSASTSLQLEITRQFLTTASNTNKPPPLKLKSRTFSYPGHDVFSMGKQPTMKAARTPTLSLRGHGQPTPNLYIYIYILSLHDNVVTTITRL